MGSTAASTTNLMVTGDQEYVMTQGDFDRIAELAYENTGIVLGPHKVSMVYSRIARRLRALRLENFTQYLKYLDDHFDQEVHQFINHITTNLTAFFREQHHFDFLKQELFPAIKNKNQRRIRLWSSGCSNGQEAYSIAMTVKQFGFSVNCDIKILATDLDSNMVSMGKEGIYSRDSISMLSPAQTEKFFQKSRDGNSVRVRELLRQIVFFKRLNLLENWPVKGPFDAIFCRNVVIYFDKDTQRMLFDRYADLLPDNGYLFLGHSESMTGLSDRFESIGNTIYRKIK